MIVQKDIIIEYLVKKFVINQFLIKKSILLIIIILQIFFLINKEFVKLKKKKDICKKYVFKCKRLKKFNIKEQIINRSPYLSVILPAYNMEKYIERALFSILNQSFQDFEIIIINDCSNDNTKDIANLYKLFLNKIIIIEHNKNLGIYASRLDGLIKSNGKYILYVDPDDLIINPHLFKQI